MLMVQVIMLMVCHLGPAETGKKQYKLFYDVGKSISSPFSPHLRADIPGPIKDMTSEMPYRQINRELNKRVPAGKAYFQAGAIVTTPTLPAIQEVIAIQARFRSEIPQARHMVGIELYPMDKVVAVPNDAMAFCCRGGHSNVIINVSWAAEDVDKVDVGEVRKRVGEIVKALQGKEGDGQTRYGNYGASRSA
jgi:hypothetical protein